MVDSIEEYAKNIAGAELEAGGVDAWGAPSQYSIPRESSRS